jgi:hypothetical protein
LRRWEGGRAAAAAGERRLAGMEGYMSKKGKRIGSRVKRYMKLEGTTLSNHHSPEAPATWQVSIKDATVTANPKRKKLTIEMYNAKMELYCDSKSECEQWMECLAAARKALKKEEEDKENSAAAAQSEAKKAAALAAVSAGPAPAESDKKGTRDERALTALSKSFKVVKPVVRTVESADSSDDEFADDADLSAEHQPRNGPRIYEETPNSMIFKQFAFQGAK